MVPGSDGAGEVVAVGPKVTRFQPGNRVMTLLHQGHLSGSLTPTTISTTGVGGTIDGCLREFGAFNEQGLVLIPDSLDFAQASTLPCAAITAWNALYGLESKSLKPGDTVLTQGTGGVSLFALQVSIQFPIINLPTHVNARALTRVFPANPSLQKPPARTASRPPHPNRRPRSCATWEPTTSSTTVTIRTGAPRLERSLPTVTASRTSSRSEVPTHWRSHSKPSRLKASSASSASLAVRWARVHQAFWMFWAISARSVASWLGVDSKWKT